MESNIEVALAVKLQKLFPLGERKFLAFPRGTGLSYEELDFMEDPGNLTAEELRQRAIYKVEFHRKVNVIPQDVDKTTLSWDMSRFLWDEYVNVLNNAILAESILTESEKKQYQEAEDFLRDEIDQVSVNSDAVNKYYEYKELHEEAERAYISEKMTVENSDDETLKEEWEAYREKELREAKDKALSDWINLGYKHDYEKYQEIYDCLGQKEPLLYRKSYLEDLKASWEAPDPNNPLGTYTTFYSPCNCFDTKQPWSRVTVQKQEANSLILSAPPELKRFVTSERLNIESISLEYKKVVIIRPWFKPDFLASHYWRLPDEATIISDGNIPRQGIIPAFITNMIVVRNIEVKRKKTADVPSSSMKLSFLAKKIKLRHKIVKMKGTKLSPVSPKIRPIIAKPVAKPTIKLAKMPRATLLKAIRSKPSRFAAAKYAGTSIRMPRRVPPARPKERILIKPREEEFVNESIELNGVAVIAYVCKRIAKSPNPDPNLTWLG